MSLRTFSSYIPESWNKIGPLKILNPTGMTLQFSIDALNLTIPKSKENEKIKILDVGAGIGVLSVYASKYYSNSEIFATDISTCMIDSLNYSIEGNKLKNVVAKVMDGQNMEELQSESFDYCFSMFGLIYFPDRLKSLKEMNRLLKSNNQSKVSIGSWQSDAFLPMALEKTYEKLTGKKLATKQPALSLDDKDLFKSELEKAGFVNVQIHSIGHPINIPVERISDYLKSENPVVDDFFKLIGDDELSINKFKETFITLVSELFPNNENGFHTVQWNCFIGIGEKL
ncbi:hypothetical protein RB653_005782 [Dictyostelium firmibasis]|uniref:Methyltransferase domain-containing protein n=1 Tax=Dictyostelium firmibasis TaxID=79012 RepID=A0AAN7U1U4_9MYCE